MKQRALLLLFIVSTFFHDETIIYQIGCVAHTNCRRAEDRVPSRKSIVRLLVKACVQRWALRHTATLFIFGLVAISLKLVVTPFMELCEMG